MAERKIPKTATLHKWKTEYKWLDFSDKKLKCSLCTKFNERLMGCRNYSRILVDGSTNYRNSVLKDHAGSQMHQTACDHESRELFGTVPKKHIVKSIPEDCALKVAFRKMSDDERRGMKRLFEIAYYIGNNGRPYSDFAGLIELEKLHGVDLPSAYSNENACKDFLGDIADTLFDLSVKSKIKRARFLSILCDGSTDVSTVETEVIYVLFVDPDSFQPVTIYFALESLEDQSSEGILNGIESAFQKADLSDKLNHLVFLTSDGTSANSGMYNGLIAKLQMKYPWVDFIWCVSHRLELALKDSLKEPIQIVEDPLRDLYSIYHRSSKKLRELKKLHDILENVYNFEHGQVRPSKFSGTRWIDHKVRAMCGFVDKFGLYIQHIENVVADTTQAKDKASLSGKLKRMKSAKVLLLGALLVDLLDRVKRLSLRSQSQSETLLSIVECVDDTILHYEMLLKKLEKQPDQVFSLLPTFSSVLGKINEIDNSYQDVKLIDLASAKQFVQNHVCDYVRSIVGRLHERYGILVTNPWLPEGRKQIIIESVTAAMRSGDAKARHICTVLDTGTWVLPETLEMGHSDLSGVAAGTSEEVLTEHSKALACDSVCDTEMLSNVLTKHLAAIDVLYESYKCVLSAPSSDLIKEQYISLVRYATAHTVCQLYNPMQMWQILQKNKGDTYPYLFEFIELCMCCPFSNAELERFFSRMGNVKTDIRNSLKPENLQDLCRVLLGPSLQTFSSCIALRAVDRWYDSKKRRLNQRKRKKYAKRQSKRMRSTSGAGTSSGDMELGLSVTDLFDSASNSSVISSSDISDNECL